jgi:hypothetical protein
MSIELKIKAKHLAHEPAIIRKEEQKLLKQLTWAKQFYQVYYLEDHSVTCNLLQKYNSLHSHRKWNVRNEARATELARAYIAGKPYSSVEQKRKPENEYKFQTKIIPRISAMVQKYGKLEQSIEDWSKLD